MADDDWPAPAGAKPDNRSYSEILSDPWLNAQDQQKMQADAAVGSTAILLLQRGERDLVALLLEVETLVPEYDRESSTLDVWLEIHPEQMPRFPEETVAKVREAFREVCHRREYGFEWLGVREILPEVGPNWREQLKGQLGGKRPTNHARRARTGPPQFAGDYLSFTNQGELVVYRALKQIQENDLPSENTIGIYPLPGGRIPGRTWEPDFLVTYRGRAGVLEIDGPHHNGRRALDTTREHLLRDAGVGFVDRVTVEALSDSAELTGVLRRFLRRLSEVK